MTTPTAPAAPSHLERARTLLDLIDDQYEGNTGRVNHDAIIRYAATAQAHATLALEAQTARLADEARTANLLAWVAFRAADGGIVPSDEQTFQIIAAILTERADE